MNGKLIEAGTDLAAALVREVAPAVKDWVLDASRTLCGPRSIEPLSDTYGALSGARSVSALSAEESKQLAKTLPETVRSPSAKLSDLDLTADTGKASNGCFERRPTRNTRTN